MTKRFKCTACGKCCFGQLPLSVVDAFANAARFPLAMVWTPVLQGAKDFAHTARIGATLPLPDRRQLAVMIVPTSFLPSTFACPELQSDNRCGIHATKPSRCRTMPLYPYRAESFQAEAVVKRDGWECDTSDAAPLVYAERKVVDREAFDGELKELVAQVPLVRQYAAYMLKYTPTLLGSLALAAARTTGTQIVTSLSSYLTATRHPDAPRVAALQAPLLKAYAERTAGSPALRDFHDRYETWAKEMTYLARSVAAPLVTAPDAPLY